MAAAALWGSVSCWVSCWVSCAPPYGVSLWCCVPLPAADPAPGLSQHPPGSATERGLESHGCQGCCPAEGHPEVSPFEQQQEDHETFDPSAGAVDITRPPERHAILERQSGPRMVGWDGPGVFRH